MNKVAKISLIAIVIVGLIASFVVIKAIKNIHAKNFADKGSNFLIVNNHDAALKSFEKSLQINPNNIEVEFKLFDQYVSLKKYDLAIELMKKQLKACPDKLWDFQRYAKLGNLYLQLGDDRSAEILYATVVKQHPKAPLGFLGLAIIYEKTGSLSQAIEYQKQAIYIMKNYYRSFPQSKLKKEEERLKMLYKKNGQE
jgi:tetratricopeptide (TPR) repeat protein